MKKALFIILALITGLAGCSEDISQKSTKKTPDFWTKEKAEKHLQNRENRHKWDKDLLANDLSYINEPQRMSFLSGVFPVPNYDLIGKGSFKGLGNFGYPGGPGSELHVGSKTVLFNSFYVKSSSVNKKHLNGMNDEVFFQILVLTDFIDTTEYSHTSSEIISRNHPDYIGQGFYRLKNNKVDYMAFIAANRNAYAIVNMRLFDLTLGKTILIAPQRDKSFRSMQIKSPKLSSETIESYTKQLIKKKEVVDFFTGSDNI
jgi:hypothetical protein